MKQFNLKEYLEHPDRNVVTREGRPVRILCTDLDDASYPVAAAIGNVNCDKFTSNGIYQLGRKTKYDLFFGPAKHEGYASICFSDGEYHLDDIIYSSEKEAEINAGKYGDFVTAVKIEWEE